MRRAGWVRGLLLLAGLACADARSLARQVGEKADAPDRRTDSLAAIVAQADSDTAAVRVFLIGDAGAPAREREPVLLALDSMLREDPARSVVVFLGDNIYPAGLPPDDTPTRKESERRLDAQIKVVKDSKARGIFVPGNHDWGGEQETDGWNAIIRQSEYIAEKGDGGRAVMLPAGGCPGPAVEDFGSVLRLVMLDTEWWLHKAKPPERLRGIRPCAFTSREKVLDSLKTVLRTDSTRRVIVVAHHPLTSGGTHGGYFTGKAHLFPLTSIKPWLRVPLPMIGSAYVAARRMGISEQDLSSSRYSHLIESLAGTFSKEEPFIYAAGHEHSQQVMQFGGPPFWHLVTGTGIYGHVSAVRALPASRYARAASGFMLVRAWPDGRVRLSVFTVNAKGETRREFDQLIAPAERPHASR